MAHGHGHDSGVHGKDYVEVAAVHPAGASDSASHHGHTIVARSTLMLVLLALVGMTAITVGAALLEKWLVVTFHVQPELATAINIGICLTIAVIKTTLVVMFFMQLKYDNPINTMIFLFCLGAVACFLGFTMLDLGNRGTIDRFKETYISPGGMGLATTIVKETLENNKGADIQPSKPITVLAKEAAIINRDYNKEEAEAEAAHLHGAPPPDRSGPNRSRPKKGIPDEEEKKEAEHH